MSYILKLSTGAETPTCRPKLVSKEPGPVHVLNPVSLLVRKHAMDFRRIRGIRDIALAQPALPATRLRRQDVASHGMTAFNLAGARLLETFIRTLMGL